jgi:hypothetical protein
VPALLAAVAASAAAPIVVIFTPSVNFSEVLSANSHFFSGLL